jgi:hypothetical protein
MLTSVKLSVEFYFIVIASVIMSSVIMPSVIMPIVILLSVVAPQFKRLST